MNDYVCLVDGSWCVLFFLSFYWLSPVLYGFGCATVLLLLLFCDSVVCERHMFSLFVFKEVQLNSDNKAQ